MSIRERLIDLVLRHDRALEDASRLASEFDAIVDSMTEAVFVLDVHERIVRANAAFVGIVGSDPSGRTLASLVEALDIRPASDARHGIPAVRALAGEHVVRTHLTLQTPHRGEVSVSATAAALTEDGSVTGAVVLWTDITEDLRRSHLSESLNELNLTARDSVPREEQLSVLIGKAAEALGCESAAYGLLDGDEWVATYVYPHDNPIQGLRMARRSVPFLRQVEDTRDIVVIDDVLKDERVYGMDAPNFDTRAFMLVPLTIREEVMALVMLAFRGRPHTFSACEWDSGRKLGTTLSLALRNARLYESLQRELIRTRVLREVAAAASGCVAVTEVCDRVANVAAEVLRASATRVFVLDQGRTRLVAGRSPLGATCIAGDEECTNAVGRVVRSNRVFTHEDYTAAGPQAVADADEALHRWVAVPIPAHDGVLGALSFMFEGRRRFNEEEIFLYRAVAEQLSVAIERAKLFEAEHRVADTLQHALLSLPSRINGIELAHLYQGASEEALVGGDFYDVFELSRDSVALLVGDVSGKGLEAASLTALVKNGIRAHALEGHDPASVLSKTNDLVLRFTSVEVYVTVFFGVLDNRTSELRYSIAGHPPPLVLREGGIAWALRGNNPILGAFPGIRFTGFREDMQGGDSLLLYTDGVVETRRNGDLFGEERLVRLGQRLAGLPPEETAQRVFEEVRQHAGGHLQDDLAIMVARIQPRRGNNTHPFQQRLHFVELE